MPVSQTNRIIQKVTACITRKKENAPPELLVFRHATAGVQLPAGTVEENETLEEAAYREVAEETGLTAVRLVQHLGTKTQDLADERRGLMQDTNFLIGPQAGTVRLNFQFGRGNWVRKIAQVDDFAEVVYENTDLNVDPPKVTVRFSGWVPEALLAVRMERAFFHFALTAQTPETWSQYADRNIFELYWTPLVPQPKLVAAQNVWLDFVYADLLESVERQTG